LFEKQIKLYFFKQQVSNSRVRLINFIKTPSFLGTFACRSFAQLLAAAADFLDPPIRYRRAADAIVACVFFFKFSMALN